MTNFFSVFPFLIFFDTSKCVKMVITWFFTLPFYLVIFSLVLGFCFFFHFRYVRFLVVFFFFSCVLHFLFVCISIGFVRATIPLQTATSCCSLYYFLCETCPRFAVIYDNRTQWRTRGAWMCVCVCECMTERVPS